jgi:NhaA family Na+:H+ antiporter
MQLDPPLGPEDHVRGDGPLELVMYGDFQCPYCTAAQSILARVERRLAGRLRFAFRHLPITELHPDAQNAAEASEEAAAQGRFWEMHDRLYAARGQLDVADLVAYAGELGLDAERVRSALADHVHADRVRRDAAGAVAMGVRGTPTFFVNGELHEGAFDAGSLVEALEATATGSSRGA